MYDFNLYIQTLLSAMLCYEKLKVEQAGFAMTARAKKEHHMNVAMTMGKRQRACAAELRSYFENRIQFVTNFNDELKAASDKLCAAGPYSLDWSYASEVYTIEKVVILGAPVYANGKPLAEFRINRHEIDETDVSYYYGLSKPRVFAHFFEGFDFLKHAKLPEGINTPELISAYLAGIDHHAFLALSDPLDPMHEVMQHAER